MFKIIELTDNEWMAGCSDGMPMGESDYEGPELNHEWTRMKYEQWLLAVNKCSL